jgi:hypothetical protein
MALIELPINGWWVDVEHPDSLSALESALELELAALDVKQLDTAVVRGSKREVTTMVAEHIRKQILFDGSEPLGIQFGSRHGGALNWALWLRRIDLGLPGSDGAELIAEHPIEFNDPDLFTASQRFHIKVF